MKFKYGDKVKIDDEFYGKREGIVKTRLVCAKSIEYLVLFKSVFGSLESAWFKERCLTKYG